MKSSSCRYRSESSRGFAALISTVFICMTLLVLLMVASRSSIEARIGALTEGEGDAAREAARGCIEWGRLQLAQSENPADATAVFDGTSCTVRDFWRSGDTYAFVAAASTLRSAIAYRATLRADDFSLISIEPLSGVPP